MKYVEITSKNISLWVSGKVQGLIPFDFEDMHLQGDLPNFSISIIIIDGDGKKAMAKETVTAGELCMKKDGDKLLMPVEVLESIAYRISTGLIGAFIKGKSKLIFK